LQKISEQLPTIPNAQNSQVGMRFEVNLKQQRSRSMGERTSEAPRQDENKP